MPRNLKRRSNAISRDNNESASEASSDSPPQRRRTSRPASDASPSQSDASEPDEPPTDSLTPLKTAIKKLVRLSLSTEYARQPLRRTEIIAKILKSETGTTNAKVTFRTVFTGAQAVLRDVFGMELVDLPGRERVALGDRRKAAAVAATQREKEGTQRGVEERETQTQGRRGKDPVLSAQSWILVSCLPAAYKTKVDLLVPPRAPDEAVESAYIGLYTIVVALLYLHTPSGSGGATGNETAETQTSQTEDTTEPISDAKLHRYLDRLGLSEWAPMGVEGANLDKLLARMLREGYVERRRDMSGGEEVVEWVVGPRGKREVGREAVAGFVRGIYGFGVDGSGRGLEMPPQGDEDDGEEGGQRRRPVKMEKDELEGRLKRTLGDVVAMKIDDQQGRMCAEPEEEERGQRAESGRRRTRDAGEGRAARPSGRRRRDDDEEMDDDE